MKRVYIKPNLYGFKIDFLQIIASSGENMTISVNPEIELEDESSMWSNRESSHNGIWNE